jgi:hypothetical protein
MHTTFMNADGSFVPAHSKAQLMICVANSKLNCCPPNINSDSKLLLHSTRMNLCPVRQGDGSTSQIISVGPTAPDS